MILNTYIISKVKYAIKLVYLIISQCLHMFCMYVCMYVCIASVLNDSAQHVTISIA